jgi:hypothetical protein
MGVEKGAWTIFMSHIHSGEPDLDSLIPTLFPLHAYISTFMIW